MTFFGTVSVLGRVRCHRGSDWTLDEAQNDVEMKRQVKHHVSERPHRCGDTKASVDKCDIWTFSSCWSLYVCVSVCVCLTHLECV